MADVNISKFRASVVRDGSKPASPGFVVSEGQDPVNPPGTNNYVPYSGATANVELGEYGVEAGFITLDTTPTNTPTDQGTIFWDADDETVDIVLNGYTMKIGEDLFYPVKNQTGSTIAKGVAVRFNGTLGASGRLLIAPFIADGSVPSSRFMGVTAEEILNGEDGKVLYFGRVRGINTNAFNEGDILYASTTVAGGYQTAIPVAPNNIVQVAAVVTKHVNNGTIFVRPTLGSNLNTDEAVKLTSVADKNLLQYQSGTALWENKTLAQILGGTTSDYVRGDGSIALFPSVGSGTVTSVGLSSATSGVTIGSTPVTTSGTITLAIATASGSQNGLLSSTDWTTFNSKQNALTNPVTGTGSAGQIAYFTGTNAITSESGFTWDATNNNLSIGGATANSNLTVNGSDNTNIFTVLAGANSRLHVGTVTSPSVSTYIRSQNNYALNLGVNTTDYLTILSSGNVGINTATPATALEVNGVGLFSGTSLIGNTKNGVYILDSNIISLAGTGGRDLAIQAQNLYFYTGITYGEKMRLTSGGNLILTSGTVSDNGAKFQVTNGNGISFSSRSGLSNLYTYAAFGRTSDELAIGIAGAADQFFTGSVAGDAVIKSLGTNNKIFLGYGSTAAITINHIGNVSIGDTNPTSSAGWTPKLVLNATLAALVVKGINGQENTFGTSNGLYIDSLGNSTGSNNQIVFRNSNSNSSFSAETRMVITSGGNVLVGGGSDNGAGKLQVNGSITVAGGVRFSSSGADANRWSVYWNGGTGDLIVVNNISDIRAKKDFDYDIKGLETITKLKPLKFTWKDGISKSTSVSGRVRQYGFIAQETMQADDFLAWHNESHDTWGIEQYESFTAVMVKAIQELKEEIDTLKN
jgi:hypothetical protein